MVVATVLAIALLAACGSAAQNPGEDRVDDVVLTDASNRQTPPADAAQRAAAPLLAFGSDVLASVAADAGPSTNVVVSPASVAIALAMLEPGAVGDARRQLHDLLRIDDAAQFHSSMSALEQGLEGRTPGAANEGEEPGEVLVRIANAAYLQRDYPFEPKYLDAIGAHYGPVLHGVDFGPDPDAVAHAINDFVAEATRERIPNLVGDGVLRRETVLALVNALYLKASWLDVFDAEKTRDGAFTRLDGTTVDVPLMHGRSGSSARGDGWVAATKSYVGGLAAQFVLPDDGRFDEIAADLPSVLAEIEKRRTSGADLVVPRFETRFGAELTRALKALGLTAPYQQGNLLGIADDRRLVLDVAIHETFVAMDEEGTEAAAATVLSAYPTSLSNIPPVPVILDRPFLLRIFDQRTGATLFLGRIVDPMG